MSLTSGHRLGHYEIVALIGAGGMGEVYRAHDTRLGRDVAIKVLPRAFTDDRERLANLEREARVVASLNHPHIAAIHGVEESEGLRGLVLEFVEGETLADRLVHAARSARPGLRLEEVLSYARQIADALEAAHEKGITHRDLKPANIKITSEGVVKLLDFGIAKVIAGEGAGIDVTHAKTVPATVEGLIVGTPGYMSPEQARGRPVDKRTDVWAFGCVLYEMLSGQATFSGDTLSDTIAAILERDPDWSKLPANVPGALRSLLQRCLAKDAKQRVRDIGDARIELDRIARAPMDAPTAVHKRRSAGTLVASAIGVAALTSVGALWLASSNEAPAEDRRVSRFTVELPEEQVMTQTFNSNVAFSPDGSLLAFTPLPGPVSIRRLDSLESQALEVTKTPGFRGAPLFSPDNAFLAFIEGNAIISASRPFLKAALSGGAAVTLTEYDNFHGGAWASDGWIYWTATYPGGIVRIRESGGTVEPVTELNVGAGERSHRFAQLLPSGAALIYTVGFEGIDSYDEARIDLWDLRTRQRKPLITGGSAPFYSPSGHIVYARAGKLYAVSFDLGRQEVTGTPFEVLDGLMMSRNTGSAHFSISARGDLVYVPGDVEGGNRTLVWVDRSGKAEPLPLKPASYLYPRLAPNGQSLAVEIEGPNHDFYFYDFARTVLSKVTTDGLSHDPVWAPDGRRVAFRSWRAGGMTMWLMNADRSGDPERLDPAGSRQSPVSFSPDGKFLVFDQKDGQTGDDTWMLPLDGDRKPQPAIRSKFDEGSAKVSPDGRWIAYSSTESGTPEIYVQQFPGLGGKIQISNKGGVDPVWRRMGGELYYRGFDGEMMVVSVATGGSEFRASAPRLLWKGEYSSGTGASCGMPGPTSSAYDVTADGQRFLMVKDATKPVGRQVVVVLNFAEEVRTKERLLKQAAARAN